MIDNDVGSGSWRVLHVDDTVQEVFLSCDATFLPTACTITTMVFFVGTRCAGSIEYPNSYVTSLPNRLGISGLNFLYKESLVSVKRA